MKTVLMMCMLAVMQSACLSNKNNSGSEDLASNPPVDAAQAKADYIQQLQERYGAAIAVEQQQVPLSCEDDGVSGYFSKRIVGGQTVLLRYGRGGDHGGFTWRVLLEQGSVLLIRKESSGWSFDNGSDIDYNNSTTSHTIDSFYEESFYFQGGELVDAFSQGAVARSFLKETISQKKAEAVSEAIQNPDPTEVLKITQMMIDAAPEGADTSPLCDF